MEMTTSLANLKGAVCGAVLLLFLVKITMADGNCTDGQTFVTFSNNSSKCCDTCKAGSGVVVPCSSSNDTQCEPCLSGKTYNSEATSYSSECRTCATCDNNVNNILHPCNITQNTICMCPFGQYYASDLDKCKPCDLCPAGWGAARKCSTRHNTVCEPCVTNVTYSDKLDHFSRCTTCSTCSDLEIMLKACSEMKDTICFSTRAGMFPRYNYSTPTVYQEHESDDGDIIPVYCSALGLVVVGLIGYVIFKHWRRLQAKRRQKAPCSHEDVEYSKASGADSGVYVESDSPKYHQYSMTSRVRELPGNKKKELEKVLLGQHVESWRLLAKEIGYNTRRLGKLDSRGQPDNPTCFRYMIQDWERSDGATIHRLVQCLTNIGRDDAARILFIDSTEGRAQTLANQSNIV